MTGKATWDRMAKAYAIFMYFCEALTIACFILFVMTGSMVPGLAAIITAIATGTFHILLQNYALHMLERRDERRS